MVGMYTDELCNALPDSKIPHASTVLHSTKIKPPADIPIITLNWRMCSAVMQEIHSKSDDSGNETLQQ